MTVLAPRIKNHALLLGFKGINAMAERSLEDNVVFYVLCIKMQNQNIRYMKISYQFSNRNT